MRKNFSRYFIVVALGLVFFMTMSAHAASIQFTTVPNTSGDGTTIVDATIDPQGQLINAVDGTITFQGVSSDDLSVAVLNGNSILTVWPNPPLFSAATNSMSFTGGIPGGITKSGLLFEMHIASKSTNSAQLVITNTTAYLNDGQGTAVPVTASPFTMTVGQQPTSSSRSRFIEYGIIVVLIIIVAGFIFRFKKRHEK